MEFRWYFVIDEPWYLGFWAGFDLETTHVAVDVARIVSASIVVVDGVGGVVEKYEWLADPGISIPAEAVAVHKITDELVSREGRAAVEVVGELVTLLGQLFSAKIPVVAYNAAYDFTVLYNETLRHGLAGLVLPAPIFDPYVVDKQVDKFRKGKRTLEAACAHYGVVLENAHTAFDDAYAAVLLALALRVSFAKELEMGLYDLYLKQVEWARLQAASYEKYLQRNDPQAKVSGFWPIDFGDKV